MAATTATAPATARGRSAFFTVDGLRFHVRTWEPAATVVVPDATRDRPPLLLLHGGMSHAHWWDPLAPRLVPAARPFAIDRRGHGDSDWATPETYGWERDLADIEAIVERLEAGPWVLVGHSQGGLLAVDLALRERFAVAGLVLLDIPLHPAGPTLRRTGRLLRKVPQLRYASLADAVRAFKPFPLPHRVPHDTLAEIGRSSFKATDDGGYTAKFHWKILQRDAPEPHPLHDFADRLTRIAVPTLCLRGAESTILSAAEHAQQVARIPHARGVEIPATTHHLHVEQPAAVAAALLTFLGSLRPR